MAKSATKSRPEIKGAASAKRRGAKRGDDASTSDVATDGATKSRRGKRGKKERLTAKNADRHELYERSVQCPEADCDFFDRVFKKRYGCKPEFLREDFCGTAFLSKTWVARRAANRALGVDLDGPTLQYGREKHLAALDDEARSRVTLIQDDVRNVTAPAVDVLAAMNFSFMIFVDRDSLRGYFETARRSLRPEGMFFLDLYGGPESMVPQEEETVYDDFSYVWDQHSFNPITHEAICHIHFKFPRGGGKLKKAFSYHWRLWSIPEITELLEEAGFKDVTVYWEGTDKDGDGNGVFRPSRTGDNSASFIVYLSATP